MSPIIGLDVPSSNSPIDPEMVENYLILNSNPQDQQRLDYNHELNVKSQECDELIAIKKYVMEIILERCNADTSVEIALESSYKDNMKIGGLIKFLMQVLKICNDAKDKNVFFGSRLTNITKHHF